MRGRRAPLCRVGRSNEPAKAAGAAVVGRASGFLETEACTPHDLAALLGCYVGSDEPPKPSRAKQEPNDLTVRFGEGQDSGNSPLNCTLGRDLGERFVDDALETQCTVVQIVAPVGALIALAKIFVGDIEGDEDRQSEQVARWRGVGGGSHLLIDVSRELGDVPFIEPTANWIALAPDLDSHHAAHGRVSCFREP